MTLLSLFSFFFCFFRGIWMNFIVKITSIVFDSQRLASDSDNRSSWSRRFESEIDAMEIDSLDEKPKKTHFTDNWDFDECRNAFTINCYLHTTVTIVVVRVTLCRCWRRCQRRRFAIGSAQVRRENCNWIQTNGPCTVKNLLLFFPTFLALLSLRRAFIVIILAWNKNNSRRNEKRKERDSIESFIWWHSTVSRRLASFSRHSLPLVCSSFYLDVNARVCENGWPSFLLHHFYRYHFRFGFSKISIIFRCSRTTSDVCMVNKHTDTLTLTILDYFRLFSLSFSFVFFLHISSIRLTAQTLFFSWQFSHTCTNCITSFRSVQFLET